MTKLFIFIPIFAALSLNAMEKKSPHDNIQEIVAVLKNSTLDYQARVQQAAKLEKKCDKNSKNEILEKLNFLKNGKKISISLRDSSDSATNFAFNSTDEQLAIGTLRSKIWIINPCNGRRFYFLNLSIELDRPSPGSIDNIVWAPNGAIQFYETRRFPPETTRYLWSPTEKTLSRIESIDKPSRKEPNEIDPELKLLGCIPTLNHTGKRVVFYKPPNEKPIIIQPFMPKKIEAELSKLSLKQIAALIHVTQQQNIRYHSTDYFFLRQDFGSLSPDLKKYFNLPFK